MKRILPVMILTLACYLAGGAGSAYAQAYDPVPVTISQDQVKIGGKMYYSHLVLERQTLFSISKAYGVSIQEIVDMNPHIQVDGTGLEKNTIILIPVKDGAPAANEDTPPAEEQTRTHVVKWYETIEDIAGLYGVSVAQIMAENQLTSKTLTSRQVLRIPPRSFVVPDETPQQAQSETGIDTDSGQTDIADYAGVETVNMTLMLALNAKKGYSGINMDFYTGVLMAMKDIEAEGTGIRLYVYDITDGAVPPVDSIALGDIILGPCAPADIDNVLKVIGDSLYMISPLDPKASSYPAEHPNVYHAASNNSYQFEEMAEWLRKGLTEESKVAVLVNSVTPGDYPGQISAALEKAGIAFSVLKDGSGTMLTSLRKGKYTDIIIASDNEAYVGATLKILGVLSKDHSFSSYAFDKVLKMSNLDKELFYPANLHITTAYYTDENSANVNRFKTLYWDLFQFEDNQFAMQGYDMAYYFIKLYATYGDKWKEYAPSQKMRLLHTDVQMCPTENGALINKAIRKVIYNKDLTVTIEQF